MEKKMRLRDIYPWDRNPRKHNVAAIKASLRRFGLVAPIEVDAATGRVVVGHGRLEALIEMSADGEATPRGVVVGKDGGWYVDVIRGDLEPADLDAYALAHNRTGELAVWDSDALMRVLDELRATGGEELIAATGFDAAEFSALMAQIDDGAASVTDVDSTNAEAADGRVRVVFTFANEGEEAEFYRLLGVPKMPGRVTVRWEQLREERAGAECETR